MGDAQGQLRLELPIGFHPSLALHLESPLVDAQGLEGAAQRRVDESRRSRRRRRQLLRQLLDGPAALEAGPLGSLFLLGGLLGGQFFLVSVERVVEGLLREDLLGLAGEALPLVRLQDLGEGGSAEVALETLPAEREGTLVAVEDFTSLEGNKATQYKLG